MVCCVPGCRTERCDTIAVLMRPRLVASVVAAAVVAAPIALDACMFSCSAAVARFAHIGAPPCHQHEGHHVTVDDQNTVQVTKSGLGSLERAAPAARLAVGDSNGTAVLLNSTAAPEPSPPARALTPLRI